MVVEEKLPFLQSQEQVVGRVEPSGYWTVPPEEETRTETEALTFPKGDETSAPSRRAHCRAFAPSHHGDRFILFRFFPYNFFYINSIDTVTTN